MSRGMQLVGNKQEYPQFRSGYNSLCEEFSAADTRARYQVLRKATSQQTISSDLTEILSVAAESMPEMTLKAVDYANRMGGELKIVNVKTWTSAAPKVENEYDGNASLLCDPIRATVIIPAENIELARAVLALHESTCAVKDLLVRPSKTGLAILNAKIELDNGLRGEIQFVTPNMYQAMQQTHGKYKEIGRLVDQFAAVAIPADVASKINQLSVDCVDIHTTGAALDDLSRYVDKRPLEDHPAQAFKI